jgi:hypothetical protein
MAWPNQSSIPWCAPHPPIRLRCATPDRPFPAAAQRSQELAPLPVSRGYSDNPKFEHVDYSDSH